jgi:hypothetical protein
MLTDEQKKSVAEKIGGTSISRLVKNLFHAIDGEAIEQKALELTGQQPGTEPGDYAREKAQQQLVTAAAAPSGTPTPKNVQPPSSPISKPSAASATTSTTPPSTPKAASAKCTNSSVTPWMASSTSLTKTSWHEEF